MATCSGSGWSTRSAPGSNSRRRRRDERSESNQEGGGDRSDLRNDHSAPHVGGRALPGDLVVLFPRLQGKTIHTHCVDGVVFNRKPGPQDRRRGETVCRHRLIRPGSTSGRVRTPASGRGSSPNRSDGPTAGAHLTSNRWWPRSCRTRSTSRPAAWRCRTGSSRGRPRARPGRWSSPPEGADGAGAGALPSTTVAVTGSMSSTSLTPLDSVAVSSTPGRVGCIRSSVDSTPSSARCSRGR